MLCVVEFVIESKDDEILTTKDFAKEVKKHLHDDYDAVIAITSAWEGAGKSTCGIQIGKHIDKNFDFHKNILYSPTVPAMRKLVQELPKYSVVDADEAIRVLYKLKWGDTLTIFLNQLYSICRQENLATILPMPRIQDFVEFFRNHKIKFWIHVLERGTAVIMLKDDNPFAPDPWHIKENYKIYTKYKPTKKTIFYTIDEKFGAFKKSTNFIGGLEFDDLNDEEKFIYRNMKRVHSYDDISIEAKIDKIKLFESVNEVLGSENRFVKDFRGKKIADLDKIMIHFSIGRSMAMQIKKMAEEKLQASITDFKKPN